MAVEVVKPVFIVGVGRSGSTIFHRVLSAHPDTAWLSTLCNRYPDKLWLNRLLMKALDWPVVGGGFKRRFRPGEWYDFWEYYCRGFRWPCRDLLACDVTNKTRTRIKDVMSQMLTPKRHRLLMKITGWPRIGFLREIFEDAKFIHVVRDGRAVVNSMINTAYWWGWRGPQNWRWGTLAPHQYEVWERYDRSFIALASIGWEILLEAVDKAQESVAMDDFLEVRYEDLCSQTLPVLRKAVEFCELVWVPEFEESIDRFALTSANYKWQEELTRAQKEIIEDVASKHLEVYGYL